MEISQLAIARLCFYAFLLGLGAGVFYDVLRISRIALGESCSLPTQTYLRQLRLPLISPYHLRCKKRLLGVVLFLEDLLFAILVGVFLILLFYQCNNGKLRFPAFPAVAAGFWLYRVTLGRVLPMLSEWGAFLVSCILRYFFFFVTFPVRRAAKKLFSAVRHTVCSLQARRERRLRRELTKRTLGRDADGLLIPQDQKLKEKERQNAKGKKKTIQPESVGQSISGGADRGVAGGVRQQRDAL